MGRVFLSTKWTLNEKAYPMYRGKSQMKKRKQCIEGNHKWEKLTQCIEGNHKWESVHNV